MSPPIQGFQIIISQLTFFSLAPLICKMELAHKRSTDRVTVYEPIGLFELRDRIWFFKMGYRSHGLKEKDEGRKVNRIFNPETRVQHW